MIPITILSTIMGLFFGLVTFVVIAVIDSAALAVPVGILAGLLFGGLLAICMLIYSHLEGKKYARYRTQNIKEPILYENSLSNLNGNTRDAGHLYITSDSLIAVIVRGNTVRKEIKIPLTTIASVERRHDYGHLANVLITQSDGTETRFISDVAKFYDYLSRHMGHGVFTSEHIQEEFLSKQQHQHLDKYISQIENPTEAFQTFLSDYFTGHPMIRGRGEEDRSVWIRLEGQERAIAMQMILDHLGHETSYIRASGIFRDERVLPMLEELVETLPKEFCYEKLLASRVLFDWTGYEKYPAVLADVLPESGEYTKVSLNEWLPGLDKETAIKHIYMLLQDKSSLVRWSAYGALLGYFKLGEQGYEDIKHYTDDSVYADKPLFQERLRSLKDRVEALLDANHS